MSEFQYLGEYWRGLRDDGIALMSGILGIMLAFLAAYLQWVVVNGRAALWICAAIAFFLAGYRVWRKERHHFEELKAKQETQVLVFEIDQRLNSSTKVQTEHSANGQAVRVL